MDNIDTMPPIGDLDHNIVYGHLQIRVARPALPLQQLLFLSLATINVYKHL